MYLPKNKKAWHASLAFAPLLTNSNVSKPALAPFRTLDINSLGGSGPLLRMADMSPFWFCTSLTIQL